MMVLLSLCLNLKKKRKFKFIDKKERTVSHYKFDRMFSFYCLVFTFERIWNISKNYFILVSVQVKVDDEKKKI